MTKTNNLNQTKKLNTSSGKPSALKQKVNPTVGTHALPNPRKMNSSVPVKKSQSTNPRFLNSSQQIKPSGIVDDLLSTGKSVAKTVSSLAEGNPLGLLEIPNSIMKVVDTTKNIIRNISESDATQKVILQDKGSLKSVGDTVVMEKLRENIPVVTTTQIPTSYAVEHTLPSLKTYDTSYPDGRKGVRAIGSCSLPSAGNTTGAQSFTAYVTTLNPDDDSFFGSRCASQSELYQMYKINEITAHWIPTVGTDYPGNMIYSFADGTNSSNQWAGGITYRDVSQRDCKQPATVKLGSNLTVKGKGDWLYVDDNGTGDPKFFASMTFGTIFYNVAPVTSPVTLLGHFFVTFDIEFKGNMEFPYSYNAMMRRSFLTQWKKSPQYTYDKWICYMWNIAKKMAQSIGGLSKSTTKLISKPLDNETDSVSAMVSRFGELQSIIESQESRYTVAHTSSQGRKVKVSHSISPSQMINSFGAMMNDPWIESTFQICRDNLIKEKSMLKYSKGNDVNHIRYKSGLEKALSSFVLSEQYAVMVAHLLYFFKDTQFIVDSILSDPTRVHKLLADVLLWIYRQHHPKIDFEIIEPNSDDDNVDEDEDVDPIDLDTVDDDPIIVNHGHFN